MVHGAKLRKTTMSRRETPARRRDVSFDGRRFAYKNIPTLQEPQMFWYAIATLTPAAALALAYVLGSVWPWLAVGSITLMVLLMDRIPNELPASGRSGRWLNFLLAGVHLALLFGGVWAIAGGSDLSGPGRVASFLALGLYAGQVSNSNAHELIHMAPRFLRLAGATVYVSLLHGHHVSAHLRVHHVHAATDEDPNSARLGEGFWTYALRALRGEFIAGLRADTAQRQRSRARPTALSHPYVFYVGGAALGLLLSFGLAGWRGLVVHVGVAAYAQLQLLLSDYVQHYGLRRGLRADGRREPVGPQHSWNAPSWYSGAMMLNAPRHSDHHLRPGRAFPDLSLDPVKMPMLPRSLPVMATIALVPPLWRRVMDRRAARWQDAAAG